MLLFFQRYQVKAILKT